jgi:NADPH-dependent ferric siderophore reductase
VSNDRKSKLDGAGGKKNKKKLRSARIKAVERIGEQFRLIDLVAKGCRGMQWQPGGKLKIAISDSETRTYTPIAIDAKSGRVRILAYIHGQSPASHWASAVAAGDLTRTSAPSSSLEFADLGSPAVFFGDETSFGSAKTLQLHLGSEFPAYCVFEVRDLKRAKAVAERLELINAVLVQWREDRSHLAQVVHRLQQAMADLATRHLVLTGNGLSIQALRAVLRTSETIPVNILSKLTGGRKRSSAEQGQRLQCRLGSATGFDILGPDRS